MLLCSVISIVSLSAKSQTPRVLTRNKEFPVFKLVACEFVNPGFHITVSAVRKQHATQLWRATGAYTVDMRQTSVSLNSSCL